MSSIFFNKIDVVQNVSCHFEQSETTFRSLKAMTTDAKLSV